MEQDFHSAWFKSRRVALGFTQMQLASRAGISLPTLQNIEAGKANPSWDILAKLNHALGCEIQFKLQPVDWGCLSQIGVPLTEPGKPLVFDADRSLLEFKKALHEFTTEKKPMMEREWEAFASFLWALRDHYPSVMAKYQSLLSPVQLERKLQAYPLGRLIKLRRLALSRINKKVFE